MHKYDLQQLKIALSSTTRKDFCVALLKRNLDEINWELLLLKDAPLPPFDHINLQLCELCKEYWFLYPT